MITQAEYEAIPENDRFNCVLEGTFYYASVHKPNRAAEKEYGSLPAFMVSVGLDKENQAKAEKFGLRILEPNDFIPEPHVKIQRKIKEGVEPNDVKPEVVDERQKEIPSTVLVGNGSKGLVKFATYWHRSSDKWGTGTAFFKMQVKELVAFEPEGDSDLSYNKDGFSIEDYLANKGKSNDSDPFPASDEPEVKQKSSNPKKKASATATGTNPDLFDE